MRIPLLIALAMKQADVPEIHPGTKGVVHDYMKDAIDRGDTPDEIIDECSPFIYEQKDRIAKERAAAFAVFPGRAFTLDEHRTIAGLAQDPQDQDQARAA